MAEPPQTYSNQRDVLRVKCDIPAEALCASSEGLAVTDAWTSGRIISLCSKGMGIELAAGAAEGDVVCLRFSLPDTEERMNTYGRVVGSSGGVISVKFVGLSLEESAQLLRYAFRQQIRLYRSQAASEDTGEPAEEESLLVPESIRRSSVPLVLDGNTEVMGAVLSGARVHVAGDIRISGNVQDAEIEARGNVVIDGGFLGTGVGKITCGGDFTARFAQNQRIEARGNVNVDKAIISSVVLTSGDVVMGADEGTIVGGEVCAYGKIEARIVGSPRRVTTKIDVGTDPLVRLAIDSMEKRVLDLTARRMGLVKRIAFLSKKAAATRGADELTDLEAASVAIQAELARIGEDIVGLRVKTRVRPDAVVIVREASHPPLDISICSSQIVSDSGTGPVIFRLLEDRIVLDTWTLK